MKIVIRKDLCCGAQLCIQAAPGLYRLDSLGYNDSDGEEVPAGQEDKARESAALCPESAISFEEQVLERISCMATLWRWTGGSGAGTWHFMTIGGEAGEALSATALMRKLEGMARGFGSLKVRATIGDSTWATSVFPSREEGWMLPVKAAVRKAEGIGEGDEVELVLEV